MFSDIGFSDLGFGVQGWQFGASCLGFRDRRAEDYGPGLRSYAE